MKFYYIDDSMFHQNAFAEQILARFQRLILKNSAAMLFISAVDTESNNLEDFLNSLKHMPVLVSPALFDIEGICGNLHKTFLEVEGYPIMQSYSGSCIEYDSITKTCQRIYLEMFLEKEIPDLDFIVNELEELLNDKLKSMKKKKAFIN